MHFNKQVLEPSYISSNAHFLHSGDAFFVELIGLFNKAKHTIHLQFYILANDTTGQQVANALKQAASRGVRVFMVIDGYGSKDLSDAFLDDLRLGGIHVKRYSPLKAKMGFGIARRMHHKICCVDECEALIGGINIANNYSGYHNKTPWLDFAVKLQGPICQSVANICMESLPRKWRKRIYTPKYADDTTNNVMQIRLLQNDWLRKKVAASRNYRQLISKADDSLIIVASYFLPGNRVRRLLKAASKRGVNISVVLGGVSDVPMVKLAITFLYPWLLKNNIKLYEWQPSVLHGKLAIADGKMVSVGSYNLNALSDYASLELNVEISNEAFAQQVEQDITQLIKRGCKEITLSQFNKTNSLPMQVLRWFSYVVIRLVLRFYVLFIPTKKLPVF